MRHPTPAPSSGKTAPLKDTLATVLEDLRAGVLTEQGYRGTERVMRRFVAYTSRGLGINDIGAVGRDEVEAFVRSPSATKRNELPAAATMHFRRSTVRLFFRMARRLGLCEGDPTLDLSLPPRSALPLRPLTDDEIFVCRSFSLDTLRSTKQSAAWALAEATATTSELPHVLVSDVNVDEQRVWLHDGSKTHPRWATLSEWGAGQIERRIRMMRRRGRTEGPLIQTSKGSLESAQAASCIAISETLRRAGLAQEPDIRPASVRAWAGRKIFEQSGSIELATYRLGMRSLDRAATLIGYEWRDGLAQRDL